MISGPARPMRRDESPAFPYCNKLYFRSSGQEPTKARLQRISCQSLRIGAVDTDLAGECRIKSLYQKRIQVFDDENDASPMIGVWPCVKTNRRMKYMLNA